MIFICYKMISFVIFLYFIKFLIFKKYNSVCLESLLKFALKRLFIFLYISRARALNTNTIYRTPKAKK